VVGIETKPAFAVGVSGVYPMVVFPPVLQPISKKKIFSPPTQKNVACTEISEDNVLSQLGYKLNRNEYLK
jgi:hypothetical protein